MNSLVFFLIFFDQLVKVLVIDFFKIELVYNRGGAFGLGNQLGGFACLAWLTGLSLTAYWWVSRSALSRSRQLALSLMVAGAWGNLIDRIFRLGPVDYLDINPWLNMGNLVWPIFNLADIYLVLGVGLLIYNYAKN